MLDFQETKIELSRLFPGMGDQCESFLDFLAARRAFTLLRIPPQAAKYMSLPLGTVGKIILFVRTCNQAGVRPTVEEIREASGLASKSTIFHHVDKLCRQGILEKEPIKARTIRIKEG